MSQKKTQSRRRKGRASKGNSIWIDRFWNYLVRPRPVGTLVAVAGLSVLAGPTVAVPARLTHGWWSTAFHFDDVTRAGSALIAVAAVLATAALWRRIRGESPADVDGDGPQRERLTNLAPALGLFLMGTAVCLSLGTWWASQARFPVSKVSLPVTTKVESYPAIDVRGSVKRMLPHRMQVLEVQPEQGAARLGFTTAAKPDDVIEETVRVNAPVDVDGIRYAVVGVEYDERVPRAILESGKEGTIPAAALKGETVRFAPDGPEFQVRQIVMDYLNALGPAVELENEEYGRFWVFQRAHPLGENFSAPYEIRMQGLETAPVAVLTIGEAPDVDLAAGLAVLFVVGLGLFLGFDERRRALNGVTSMNAASVLMEEES